MAIKANNLDDDLKVFENEETGSVESVEKEELKSYLHQEQEDSFGGEDSGRVKKFFDFLGVHVFLPWLQTITKVLNALKSNVEDCLKKTEVKDTYNTESKDPISGKGVKEALDGLPIRKGSGENSVETGVESNKATGARSFVGGNGATATGSDGFSYGLLTKAGGKHSAAFNSNTEAAASDCFVTGEGTYAGSNVQRVAGKFNEKDTEGKYADIVGNGSSDTERSNAYTLDWEGNGYFAGSVTTGKGKLETKDEVINSLFPVAKTMEDITAQAGYYQLPSDDAKVKLECDESPDYIYLCTPDFTEPAMYIREGATSPYLFPDDFANQEDVAKYWKAGNYFESSGHTKATVIFKKKQTDKEAVSPSRLQVLIEAATEEKTICNRIASNGQSFTVTDEMAKTGLVVRVSSSIPTDYFYWSLAYSGPKEGELYGNEMFNIGKVHVNVSELAGCTVLFTFQDTDGHYGIGHLEQQLVVRSISLEKLAEFLSEEVSEE